MAKYRSKPKKFDSEQQMVEEYSKLIWKASYTMFNNTCKELLNHSSFSSIDDYIQEGWLRLLEERKRNNIQLEDMSTGLIYAIARRANAGMLDLQIGHESRRNKIKRDSIIRTDYNYNNKYDNYGDIVHKGYPEISIDIEDDLMKALFIDKVKEICRKYINSHSRIITKKKNLKMLNLLFSGYKLHEIADRIGNTKQYAEFFLNKMLRHVMKQLNKGEKDVINEK